MAAASDVGATDEQQLERLVVRWAEAVRDRDIEFLDELLSPEFTLTTGRPAAEIRSRDEWLEVTRERYVVDSFDFEWIDARSYGCAGLVRSRYRQHGSMDGQVRTQPFLVTDVFVKTDDGWQAVARHLSPLAPS